MLRFQAGVEGETLTWKNEVVVSLISAATMPGTDGERERAAVNFAFIDARLVRPFS